MKKLKITDEERKVMKGITTAFGHCVRLELVFSCIKLRATF